MSVNIYCDESCHLEHDDSNVMGIGAIWLPSERLREINKDIKNIKIKHRISKYNELKWVKVSNSKYDVYEELVNYFFDNNDLHFRCLVIQNKSELDHKRFNQSHDEWYYKMYFEMLKAVYDPKEQFNVYLDIKDTNSNLKIKKLSEVCRNSIYDFSQSIIRKIQTIRSDEVRIMQLVDILMGAVVYTNRDIDKNNEAKVKLSNLIKERSHYDLTRTTLLRESKFNLFMWQSR